MVSNGVKYEGEIIATLSPAFRYSGFAQFSTTCSSGLGTTPVSSSSLLHDIKVMVAIITAEGQGDYEGER
jgi:hypothetical protein